MKRIFWLYTGTGRAVRWKMRRGLLCDSLASARLLRANHRCTDFIVNGLANSSLIHFISVLNVCRPKCLVLVGGYSLRSERVTWVPQQVKEERCRPKKSRSRDSSELCFGRVCGWTKQLNISVVHIQSCRSVQNGQAGSMHGRLRDKSFTLSCLRTLHQGRIIPASWPQEDNRERLRNSLRDRTRQRFNFANTHSLLLAEKISSYYLPTDEAVGWRDNQNNRNLLLEFTQRVRSSWSDCDRCVNRHDYKRKRSLMSKGNPTGFFRTCLGLVYTKYML